MHKNKYVKLDNYYKNGENENNISVFDKLKCIEKGNFEGGIGHIGDGKCRRPLTIINVNGSCLRHPSL